MKTIYNEHFYISLHCSQELLLLNILIRNTVIRTFMFSNFILCHNQFIYNTAERAISISLAMHHMKRSGAHFECRETKAAITLCRPVRERTVTKSRRAFWLTSITNHKLEEARCIMVGFRDELTIGNRVSSLVIMNVATITPISLLIGTKVFCFVFYLK